MNASQLLKIMEQSSFPRIEVRLNNGDSIVVEEPFLLSVDKGEPSFAVYGLEEKATTHISYRNTASAVSSPPKT